LAGVYAASQASPLLNTRAYILQMLGQAANHLRVSLDKYDGIAFQFVANRDLNNLLDDYVRAKDNYEVALQNQGFTNYLEGYAFGDDGIYDALFIDEANLQRKALTMGEALPNSFVRAFPQSELYRKIRAADGRAVWCGGVEAGAPGGVTVALGRRIKHLFTGRPLGILVIFLRQEHLTRLAGDYLKANFYFSLGTLRGNYVMLVDGRDRVISTALPENLGRKVGEIVAPAGPLGSLLPRQQGKGSFLGRLSQREQVLVAYQKVKGTDWTLLVPVSGALVAGAIRGLLPLFAVLLLGGATVLFWPARRQPRLLPSALGPARALEASSGLPICQGEPAWLASLSEREREILCLLAQGRSNKEIAGTVFVAEQTVKNYVSTIYHKLDVHDRVQAARKAIQSGLLRDDST
jgi:DNA-binding CsgD family transcriptional regulator